MFRLNWSISDWQEARRGDYFYMMRTTGDDAGIIFSGQLITDPYPDEDWTKGHSGELLPRDVADKLDDILSTPLAI